jgi:predicted  nucleic acid-binding Zn-ribbon protein
MAQYVCIDCGERFEPVPSPLGPTCPACGSRKLRLADAMHWEEPDNPDDPTQECAV